MSINIQTAQSPRSKSELRCAIAEAEYNVALQARRNDDTPPPGELVQKGAVT